MKRIAEYRIVDLGVEHEQYFQGHGIALTRWDTCATGIGSTPREALDDALEQLACGDECDPEDLDQIAQCDDAPGEYHPDLAPDHWCYVSVDIRWEDT